MQASIAEAYRSSSALWREQIFIRFGVWPEYQIDERTNTRTNRHRDPDAGRPIPYFVWLIDQWMILLMFTASYCQQSWCIKRMHDIIRVVGFGCIQPAANLFPRRMFSRCSLQILIFCNNDDLLLPVKQCSCWYAIEFHHSDSTFNLPDVRISNSFNATVKYVVGDPRLLAQVYMDWEKCTTIYCCRGNKNYLLSHQSVSFCLISCSIQ